MNNKLAYLIIPFSGFYITALPLSPIYFFYLITFFFLFIQLIQTKRLLYNSLVGYSIFIFIYTLISQFITGFETSSLVGFLFSIAYFITSLIILNKSSHKTLINASIAFIYLSIILLSIETFWRLSHPVFFINNSAGGFKKVEGIYPYKLSSIMYLDSNFVGLFIVCLFFFSRYIFSLQRKKKTYTLLVIFALALLTFSRAAIISIVIFYFIFKYIGLLEKIKLHYIFFGLAMFLLGLFYVYIKFYNDESFNSKFSIIYTAFAVFSNFSLPSKLFGIGYGNTANYLQIGAHNILITYLFESGYLGISFLTVFWILISRKTKNHALYILLPFVFAGFSLTTHAVPYLYCMLSILYNLNNRPAEEQEQLAI